MNRPPGRTYLSSPEAQALAQTFTDNVRAALHARGWTQLDLAAAADMDKSTLGTMLRGVVTPTLVGAARIATALNTTVDRLLGLSPEIDIRDDRLFCLHTPHWVEGTSACPQCTSAWRNLQAAKQKLYAEGRAAPSLINAVTGQRQD